SRQRVQPGPRRDGRRVSSAGRRPRSHLARDDPGTVPPPVAAGAEPAHRSAALIRQVERMKINGIIWLEDIVEKLERKHAVGQEEVRQVFANSPRFRFVEKGHRRGENVYSVGQTSAGRYLI